MTLPDAIGKSRNLLAVVGAIAVTLSAGFALSADWWLTPFDYWLVHAAWATGFGGGVSIVAVVIMQIDLTTRCATTDQTAVGS